MPKFQPPPVQQALVNKDQTPTHPFQRWLETVQQSLSSKGAPLTSTAAGTPIQFQGFETDGEFLYVCVGQNQWKRIPLNDF